MKFALLLTVFLTTSPGTVGAETAWLRIGAARPTTSSPAPTCATPDPSLCPPPIKSGYALGANEEREVGK